MLKVIAQCRRVTLPEGISKDIIVEKLRTQDLKDQTWLITVCLSNLEDIERYDMLIGYGYNKQYLREKTNLLVFSKGNDSPLPKGDILPFPTGGKLKLFLRICDRFHRFNPMANFSLEEDNLPIDFIKEVLKAFNFEDEDFKYLTPQEILVAYKFGFIQTNHLRKIKREKCLRQLLKRVPDQVQGEIKGALIKVYGSIDKFIDPTEINSCEDLILNIDGYNREQIAHLCHLVFPQTLSKELQKFPQAWQYKIYALRQLPIKIDLKYNQFLTEKHSSGYESDNNYPSLQEASGSG